MSYEDLIAKATERAHGGEKEARAVLAAKPPSDPEKLLDYLSDLQRAIEQAYSIADTLVLKDRADSMRWLTRRLALDRELRNKAAETVIRAERKLGEMLLQTDKNQGGNPNLLQTANGWTPTYAELGIEPTAAHRWQTVARLPVEKFEGFILDTREAEYELTSGGMLAYAKNVLKDKHVPGPTPPDHTLNGDAAHVLWDLVGVFNRAGQVLVKIWWRK